MRPKHYPAVILGPLPVATVNATLGTELEPGTVRLSSAAHRHMAEDHPEDYATCLAALTEAVTSPTYIGQSPRHARNFELVKRIARADGRVVLVAIGLEPDETGAYRVRSAYLVPARTVETRRQARTLKVPVAR